jgi:soluble cytochrome b562
MEPSMSTNPTIDRLEALKRSLEVARDVKHDTPQSIRDVFESHVKGLRAGLQIAIDAIDTEVQMIQAGASAAARFNQ